MLMLTAAATALLWQAGTMSGMAHCRTATSGRIGPEAAWSTDGKGWLSISTTPRTAGRVELQCRIPVTKGVPVALELDWAAFDFTGSPSRQSGSGITLTAEGVKWELLRVAGEQSGEMKQRRAIVVPAGTHLLVTMSAVDESASDPVRIDVRGLRLVRIDH
ncbi:MAG TPA: hypothetical protein VES20_18280 [Bryobacteraceae bacterium]|nr:hypothetical protein [Bryobacteraceae bacterium]